VRFLFDGTRINPTQTPKDLDMEDGDSIDAMMEQVGGC
jgi:small ubiquitin-related modifier